MHRTFFTSVIIWMIVFTFIYADGWGNEGDKPNPLAIDGLEANLICTHDIFSNIAGGQERGTANLGLLDCMLSADLEQLLSVRGTSIFCDGVFAYGKNPSDFAGDIQGVSNIASEPMLKLYECWLCQSLWKETGSVLIGIYDLNSEFDVNEFSGAFLNGSFGMGPDFSQSGVNGVPTYPNPALTLRFRYDLNEQFYWLMAVADGVPGNLNEKGLNIKLSADDGALICTEFGLQTHLERLRKSTFKYERQHIRRSYLGTGNRSHKRQHPRHSRHDLSLTDIGYPCRKYCKLAAGIWFYTSEIENFLLNDESPEYTRCWGAYLLGEKVLWSVSERFISGFFRAGYANPVVNPVNLYCGCGLVYTGPSSRSRYHQLGLAVAVARVSDDYREKMAVNNREPDKVEIAIELICRLRMNQWIMMQPDLQYIINPGINPGFAHALVPGLRLEITI